MFEELLTNAGHYVQTNPWMAFVAVFVGGLLSAAAPCVLAMVPLMMSFVAGRQDDGLGARRAFGYSLVFVLGLSITFTALGIIAVLAKSVYGDVSVVWRWLVAVVCVVMGLHLTGAIEVPLPAPKRLPTSLRGALGAFVLGLLFGVVSAPCAAPILVVLFAYLMGADASVVYGGALLFTYGLGHSVLVIIAGTSMGLARKLIENRGISRTLDVLRRVAGGVIILVGVYFLYQALAA